MISGIFENYTRVINSRINGLLHTTCEISVESVEEQRYYEFSNALTEGDVLVLADVQFAHNQQADAQSSAAYRLGRLRFRLGEPSPRSGRCRSLRPDRAQNPVKAYGSIEMHPKVISLWGAFHLKVGISYQSPSSSWNRISQRL